MAVNRAILEYADGFSKLEEPCLWYKPRSDFINLKKLIRLVLTKKKEKKKKRNQQGNQLLEVGSGKIRKLVSINEEE